MQELFDQLVDAENEAPRLRWQAPRQAWSRASRRAGLDLPRSSADGAARAFQYSMGPSPKGWTGRRGRRG